MFERPFVVMLGFCRRIARSTGSLHDLHPDSRSIAMAFDEAELWLRRQCVSRPFWSSAGPKYLSTRKPAGIGEGAEGEWV